jgi:hypothetical protein
MHLVSISTLFISFIFHVNVFTRDFSAYEDMLQSLVLL